MSPEVWTTTHGDTVEVFARPFGILLPRWRWYWHVRSVGNGEIVEQGEAYSRRIDAIAAAERHHPHVQADR